MRRRFLSTFYDSQSGRYMKAPGAEGIRIHALPGFPQPFPPQITSYHSPHRPSSPPTQPIPCYTLCRTPADIENAFRSNLGCVLSAPSGSCDTLEPLINLATQQTPLHPLRAVIEQCWEVKGSGSSKNVRQHLIENDAGLLADAGVPIITLSDCLGACTEDTLREIVEFCFNLDIAGDAYLERLSLRIPPHLITAALEMKVTRFETAQQLPPELC